MNNPIRYRNQHCNCDPIQICQNNNQSVCSGCVVHVNVHTSHTHGIFCYPLFLLIHIRWFSWTECWRYHWSRAAHFHWSYINTDLGCHIYSSSLETIWLVCMYKCRCVSVICHSVCLRYKLTICVLHADNIKFSQNILNHLLFYYNNGISCLHCSWILLEVKQYGKVEVKLKQHQYLTQGHLSVYSYFDFSLPADDKCKSFCAITPGYLITSVFVIGVALLGQTSFEIDTVPING